MKTQVTIYLNDFVKTRDFAQAVSKFESDIDIVRDRYVIDAKSIMGIYTLDLSKPVDVVLHSDDNAEIDRFIEVMKEFE